MECVAYMRVSTEKQAVEGNGLDSQKRDIENYCRKNELVITDWYIDDGYTGTIWIDRNFKDLWMIVAAKE